MPPTSQESADLRAIVRRAAAIDLFIAIAFFLAVNACEPKLDPILRRGQGLPGVLAMAGYQFTLEGLAVLGIIVARRESFASYGFTRRNVGKSIALGLVLAGIYDLAASFHAGGLMWIPLRRHTGIRMSLAAGLPASVAGIAITIAVWGFLEGFFGIFFAKKLNLALGSDGQGWLAPGALGFALFNGMIHLAIGQGLEGFAFSFASGYAIAVVPGVTENGWGGTLVQALTNSVGKM